MNSELIFALTAVISMAIMAGAIILVVKNILNYLIRFHQQAIEPTNKEIKFQKVLAKQTFEPVDLENNDVAKRPDADFPISEEVDRI